jgi:putative sterol carrier protein
MEADLPSLAGRTATIHFDVTGGPDGDTSCRWAIKDGHLSVGEADGAGSADVVLTMESAVAESIRGGELDPNVAFMRGRMKAAGSMEVLMALLPVSRSGEFRNLLPQITSNTES